VKRGFSAARTISRPVGPAASGPMTLDFASPAEHRDRKHAARAVSRAPLDETRVLPLHLLLGADEPDIGRRPD
jgi:hypothetical protein